MDPSVVRRSFWTAAPAIAALLVYAATFGAGYLYDDDVLIRTNPWVHDSALLWQLPVKPLLPSAGMGSTNYYRPVVNVFYNLMWQCLGGRPFAFHVLNVVVHMLNATLVLMLVRRVTGRQGIVALGAAVLFAVHPLNSEVVAWPSCLPELGYVAFGLSSLLLHMTAWGETGGRARRIRLAAYLLFGLACSCKETALAFVPLIVLLEVWLRPATSERKHPGILAALRSAVPYLAAATIYFAVRTVVLGGLIPRGAHGLRTTLDAVWNAPGLLLLYARMMVFPSPLLVEHIVKLEHSPVNARFLVGVAVVGAGVVATWRLRRTRPDLAFAACMTVLPLLPALYLPALGRDIFAERYAYLGVLGFCFLLVGGAEALTFRPARPTPAWVLPVFLYVLAIAAAARTARRCGDWFDNGTLGKASIRDEPKAAIGYLLEGDWLKRQGLLEEAWGVFQDGLSQVPDSVELQLYAIGLGVELDHMTHDDVMAEYERLVPLARDSPSAEFNLGHALLEGGRLDAAQAAFTRALELTPSSVASMTALAEVALRRGDSTTAAALWRRALVIDPNFETARQSLERLRQTTR